MQKSFNFLFIKQPFLFGVGLEIIAQVLAVTARKTDLILMG
jgi:hypothetical protein